jgi:Lsr2
MPPNRKAINVAQRTVVQLTDDLDGKAIPDGKGETVRFGLDSQDYEIDLGEKNAKALRDVVAKYVDAGRRVGGGSRGGRTRASAPTRTRDYDPKAVRAWAESQGLEVSQRGRVPSDLVTKFQEANA